jgi:hypothetical protein
MMNTERVNVLLNLTQGRGAFLVKQRPHQDCQAPSRRSQALNRLGEVV